MIWKRVCLRMFRCRVFSCLFCFFFPLKFAGPKTKLESPSLGFMTETKKKRNSRLSIFARVHVQLFSFSVISSPPFHSDQFLFLFPLLWRVRENKRKKKRKVRRTTHFEMRCHLFSLFDKTFAWKRRPHVNSWNGKPRSDTKRQRNDCSNKKQREKVASVPRLFCVWTDAESWFLSFAWRQTCFSPVSHLTTIRLCRFFFLQLRSQLEGGMLLAQVDCEKKLVVSFCTEMPIAWKAKMMDWRERILNSGLDGRDCVFFLCFLTSEWNRAWERSCFFSG